MQTGYKALREAAAWIDLSARGKIRVVGEDAGRLLHAMSTNNISDLLSNHGIYAFFLTDKGRIQADAYVFRLGGEYWLDTEPEGASVVHHHLDRYIIADDAEVKDETTAWLVLGIEGPESVQAMERLGLPVPEEPLDLVVTQWGYVARAASTGPSGFRVWAKTGTTDLYNQLATSGIPQAVDHEAYVVRLENGIPRFGDDISERYLVQETQRLQAVSFTKGCYLGQEIVERVRSQGKVHRLLTPIRISGDVAPAAGSKLVFNEAPAGEVTSAAYSPALAEIVGFAYVRAEVLDARSEMQVAGMDISVRARVA